MIFSHCQVVILLSHISLFEQFIFYGRNWGRERQGLDTGSNVAKTGLKLAV